jgi:hypothetical protein
MCIEQDALDHMLTGAIIAVAVVLFILSPSAFFETIEGWISGIVGFFRAVFGFLF